MAKVRASGATQRLDAWLWLTWHRLRRALRSSTGYFEEVLALFRSRRTIRIVVVGANDGRINDPIYRTAMRLRQRVEIVLIEPQSAVIPHLQQNYEGHPGATILHAAVGPPGTLELHAVREEYWDKAVLPYGVGWPAYRAPTGITSSDRAAVADWVQAYIPGVTAEEAIWTETIACVDLEALLRANGIDWGRIDVLQVDTEGFDDVVLANSGLERLRPSVIHFESKMLPRTGWQQSPGCWRRRVMR
jgi:FkbM family methyltransferase